MYNIHDIRQAGDLPNTLKAIFRRFALFCLIKGQSLQTVAWSGSPRIYIYIASKPQTGVELWDVFVSEICQTWVLNQKIGDFYPKMDGENNGKPYFLMDGLGGKTTIFGNIHIASKPQSDDHPRRVVLSKSKYTQKLLTRGLFFWWDTHYGKVFEVDPRNSPTVRTHWPRKKPEHLIAWLQLT